MVFMLTCIQEDKVSNFSSPENRQLLGELSGIDTLLQCLSVSCFSCKLQASDIVMLSLRLFNHKHSDSNTICTWVLVISHFKMPLHQATVVATYLIAKLMFPKSFRSVYKLNWMCLTRFLFLQGLCKVELHFAFPNAYSNNNRRKHVFILYILHWTSSLSTCLPRAEQNCMTIFSNNIA